MINSNLVKYILDSTFLILSWGETSEAVTRGNLARNAYNARISKTEELAIAINFEFNV